MRYNLIIFLLILSKLSLDAQTIPNEEFEWKQINQCYCNALKASNLSAVCGVDGSGVIKSPKIRAVIDLVSSDFIGDLNRVLHTNMEISSPKAVIKIELILGRDLSICVERIGAKDLLISNDGYNSLVKLLQSLQLSKVLFRLTKVIS